MINLKSWRSFVLSIAMIVFMVMSPVAFASDIMPNENELAAPVMQALPEAGILPDVRMFEKTHPQKIIFSQMKLAQMQPDLDELAKASPFVVQAQEIDKSAMIFSEYNRIANSYNLHDPYALLSVHSVIPVDQYSSLQDILVFDEFDETTFFKFNYYGHNVAIVPQGIESFQFLRLSKPSAERFFRELKGSGKAVAEFLLMPFYSDSSKPIEINGVNYWLMAARIAEFRLWSSNDPEKATLLWFYRSPNYSPVDKKDINNLYLDTVTQ